MALTAPVGVTGVPFWSTSCNEPSMTDPLFELASWGPVSLTVPTKVFAGIGLLPPGPLWSTVSVTSRPASSATIELSKTYVEDEPAAAVSLRAPGELPEPPRTMPATQSAGTFVGAVWVHTGGRSIKLLLPGPGNNWSPEVFVPSVEFGPVGSVGTFLPNRFSPAASALIPALALGWSPAVGA